MSMFSQFEGGAKPTIETPVTDTVTQEAAVEAVQPEADAAPVVEGATAEAGLEANQDTSVQAPENQIGDNAELTGGATDAIATESSTDNVVTQDADAAAVPTQEAPAPVVLRSAANKSFAVMTSGLFSQSVARHTDDLRQSLRDVRLMQSLSQVAQENNLSAPLVAAFQAVPGFNQVAANFPDASLFDNVPDDRSSAKSVAGLESLDAGLTTTSETMKTKATDLVGSFGEILAVLPATIESFRAQIAEDTMALESSDLSDEVLEHVPTFSLSDSSFNVSLSKLEQFLQTVAPFNADHLAANPETTMEQIQGLQNVVADTGSVFGLTLDGYGLRDTARDTMYIPTMGNFGDKGITLAGMQLLLSRSNGLLDTLSDIAARKDELMAAAMTAVSETPTQLDTTDTVYGALDHMTLLSCYVSFATKMVTESVQNVAMVLSTVDSALDLKVASAD